MYKCLDCECLYPPRYYSCPKCHSENREKEKFAPKRINNDDLMEEKITPFVEMSEITLDD